MAYVIKWCEDLRGFGETRYNRRELELAATSDEEAIRAFRRFVESNPENPRTPYSQQPFLEKVETIFTIDDLQKELRWPVSREEALKAADRVAELDDQEGLGELTVERSEHSDPSED